MRFLVTPREQHFCYQLNENRDKLDECAARSFFRCTKRSAASLHFAIVLFSLKNKNFIKFQKVCSLLGVFELKISKKVIPNFFDLAGYLAIWIQIKLN